MSSFINKFDCDDVDFGPSQEAESSILKGETEFPSNESTVHPVKAELPPPDEVTFEDSIKEEESFQEEIEGDSTSQNESVTKPEVVWFIKSEPIDEEETHSMECKGLLITPKLEDPPHPSRGPKNHTFAGSTVHELKQYGKMKALQCDQQMKLPSKEKPHLKLNEEEIQDNFIKGKCDQSLNVKNQANDEILFKCNYCCKMPNQKGNLHIHSRIHRGEKPYECNQCNMRFSHTGSLKNHLKVHTNGKPFNCSQCNKKFKEKGHLQNHLKVHTGEKPFECSQCNKKFSQNGNLQKHLRLHTGEKPFECSQCNKKFSQCENLQKHLKVHKRHLEARLDGLRSVLG